MLDFVSLPGQLRFLGLTIGLLFISSITLVRQKAGELWLFISYLLLLALLVIVRILLVGEVPVNETDTIGIFVISFVIYLFTQISSTIMPMLRGYSLVKLFPLLSLLTIPWSETSLHTSLTLFVLGMMYFVSDNNHRIIRYAGFALINLAVYLWMPALSEYTGLLLFYVIPVAASILLVTHLHRNEMQAELQNKVRLIVLSLFYVVISADVFLNESLFVFILGLLMGLAGILYGISSKIRAFLYSGVIFMLFIILGQLMLFYPEGRLARALILMVTGAFITGAMIWFNIKRELFLSRVRVFRADLDSWE